MTLPRLAALTRRWQDIPPAAVQIGRIARWLGAVPDRQSMKTNPIQQARSAGIPLMEGVLPDDADIGFLDERIGLGQGLNIGVLNEH